MKIIRDQVLFELLTKSPRWETFIAYRGTAAVAYLLHQPLLSGLAGGLDHIQVTRDAVTFHDVGCSVGGVLKDHSFKICPAKSRRERAAIRKNLPKSIVVTSRRWTCASGTTYTAVRVYIDGAPVLLPYASMDVESQLHYATRKPNESGSPAYYGKLRPFLPDIASGEMLSVYTLRMGVNFAVEYPVKATLSEIKSFGGDHE